MKQYKNTTVMLPLLLVIFIDGMGLGLFFPIFNAIIISPESTFLSASTSSMLRNFYYGLSIGIFMICWFFGAAILGDLSDTAGRKKCLMVCLIGAFISYLISAISISLSSFWLLILGRIIAGFTAGSQPIAQAAIVDISKDDQRANNIGLILLASSLGFVLGPVFGGILSDSRIASWFTFSTPMYFAALLSLLNAFILQLTFKETLKDIEAEKKIRWHHAMTVFTAAFKHEGIKRYSIVLLVMIFGWSNYFSFIPKYLLEVYNYNTLQNSLFLATLGLGFSLGCGYIVNLCTRYFQFNNIVIVGLFFTALQVLITIIAPQAWVVWVAGFGIGVGLSVAYSVLLTIFSHQVSNEEQGWVMGVTGSVMALCFGLTSVFTGLIASIGVLLPMLLALLGLTLSALILFYFSRTGSIAE
jgi:predicted MFS family arabinose efflux permease